MTTFGELINKANDKDAQDIRDVMASHFEKTEKDNITPDIISKSKKELDRLRGSMPMSQGDFVSIESWKKRHEVFLYYVNKKGGRKRRKKTRRRRRKRTRKGGFLLLGYAAYKAYNGLTKKTKKRRRKKRRKNKK